MTTAFGLPQKLIVLAIVLPLAALVGYLLADPMSSESFLVVGAVLGILLIPVLINNHHPLLLFALNANIDIFFLPGKPRLWMLMALISVSLSLLNRIINKDVKILQVRSLTWTLLALAAVVVVTAELTGGLGMRSMGGSTYGGKKYFFILFAIVAYFAISVRPIPVEKAGFYSGLYVLASMTSVMSNLIYLAGPALWWLYLFFPVDFAMGQAQEDFGMDVTGVRFTRLAGFGPAASGIIYFMLMRFGIRGLLDWSRPWRLPLIIGLVVVGLLGGFRSTVVILALLFSIQFVLEGLLRTKIFLYWVMAMVLGFIGLVGFASKLPLSMQRSLTILPFIELHPYARADAQASSEWRLEMWRWVAPEVPKHIWFGKGYTATATEYYLANEAFKRGHAKDYENAILAGDFHNGPLSIIIPLGIWGVLAFCAFAAAALRVLYLNYRNGDPALRRINTFFLSYFITKLAFFCGVFGDLPGELVIFVGIVGLSVSLNHGVRAKRSEKIQAAAKTLSQSNEPAHGWIEPGVAR